MHLDGCGETERVARQALDSRAQREVLAFQLLRVARADFMERGIEMALVRAPAIGRKAGDAKGFQQGLQGQEGVIVATAKNIGKHFPGSVIQGMPEPAGSGFAAYKGPHSRADSAEGRRPSTGPEKRSAPRAGQRRGGAVARRWRPLVRSLRDRNRL